MEAGWVAEHHWTNPDKQGELKKLSKGLFGSKWKTYWFRVKNSSLFWFKNEHSKSLRGHIALEKATAEIREYKNMETVIYLKSKKQDRTFYLVADDFGDAVAWTEAIRKGIESFIQTRDIPLNPKHDMLKPTTQQDPGPNNIAHSEHSLGSNYTSESHSDTVTESRSMSSSRSSIEIVRNRF